ncbi:MAG: hypothetical protein WBQ13_07155, partial [Terriglobales bacterium]
MFHLYFSFLNIVGGRTKSQNFLLRETINGALKSRFTCGFSRRYKFLGISGADSRGQRISANTKCNQEVSDGAMKEAGLWS